MTSTKTWSTKPEWRPIQGFFSSGLFDKRSKAEKQNGKVIETVTDDPNVLGFPTVYKTSKSAKSIDKPRRQGQAKKKFIDLGRHWTAARFALRRRIEKYFRQVNKFIQLCNCYFMALKRIKWNKTLQKKNLHSSIFASRWRYHAMKLVSYEAKKGVGKAMGQERL